MKPTEASKIIEDARQAGMIIVQDSGSDVVTVRKSPKGVAVTLWPNGSATRADVRLDHALCLRSAVVVRKILGLA